MKHVFISYIQVSTEWAKATMDERKNFFTKIKESAKEHGFNLLFLGNPWGVIESIAVIFESENCLEKYVEWRRAFGQLGLPAYIQASRTITITETPLQLD